jgi:hypothetical protein
MILTRLSDEFTQRAFAVAEVGELDVGGFPWEKAVRDYHAEGCGKEEKECKEGV